MQSGSRLAFQGRPRHAGSISHSAPVLGARRGSSHSVEATRRIRSRDILRCRRIKRETGFPVFRTHRKSDSHSGSLSPGRQGRKGASRSSRPPRLRTPVVVPRRPRLPAGRPGMRVSARATLRGRGGRAGRAIPASHVAAARLALLPGERRRGQKQEDRDKFRRIL
jgi:hypothetical protein